MSKNNPENDLDSSDPGDETFRRFRYQATYAAILSLGMVKEKSEISEIFVEHHDDILIKMKSDRFIAVQVKTQQLGTLPFKSGDEPMKKALGKFVRHEMNYGQCFERYTIATNHHFFREENKSSIPHLVKMSKNALGPDKTEMDSKLSAFINSFLSAINKGKKGKERASRKDMLLMLKKVYCDDSLPKLEEEIHKTLRMSIVEVKHDYRSVVYTDLERAANALSHLSYLRSSKFIEGIVHLYLPFTNSPSESQNATIINSKRITKRDILTALDTSINYSPSLSAANPIDPENIPNDLSLCAKKMTAGSLSATTISASEDWLASAQSIQRKWAMKYDEQVAKERYNHVAVAVQTACSEAHEATADEAIQGPPMLKKLKEVLKRKRDEGTNFFDCQEEHLLGHATIRTSQCKVWWSKEFKIS